jgi:hypothetical protein
MKIGVLNSRWNSDYFARKKEREKHLKRIQELEALIASLKEVLGHSEKDIIDQIKELKEISVIEEDKKKYQEKITHLEEDLKKIRNILKESITGDFYASVYYYKVFYRPIAKEMYDFICETSTFLELEEKEWQKETDFHDQIDFRKCAKDFYDFMKSLVEDYGMVAGIGERIRNFKQNTLENYWQLDKVSRKEDKKNLWGILTARSGVVHKLLAVKFDPFIDLRIIKRQGITKFNDLTDKFDEEKRWKFRKSEGLKEWIDKKIEIPKEVEDDEKWKEKQKEKERSKT